MVRTCSFQEKSRHDWKKTWECIKADLWPSNEDVKGTRRKFPCPDISPSKREGKLIVQTCEKHIVSPGLLTRKITTQKLYLCWPNYFPTKIGCYWWLIMKQILAFVEKLGNSWKITDLGRVNPTFLPMGEVLLCLLATGSAPASTVYQKQKSDTWNFKILPYCSKTLKRP